MEHRVGSVSRRPVRRQRAARWFWRISLGLFLVLAFGIGAWVGRVYFGSPTVRRMVHDWRVGNWEPAKAFPGRDEVTVLVLGRDVDHDRKSRVLRTFGRSDTILLVRLDFAKRAASILSIPRDTMVRIPGYGGRHKINAAHAFGGPELAEETVEDFLDVHPEEYITVDYESFEKLVDQLGGLQVTVAKQMDYDDNWGGLHIHLRPGPQVLDGGQALGFARFRKSRDGYAETDEDRIERQHELVMAAKRKLISTSTFARLPEIIETIHGGVNSSMNDAQLMSIAQFMRSLPPDCIQMATLPGDPGRVYVTADENAARELVRKMF